MPAEARATYIYFTQSPCHCWNSPCHCWNSPCRCWNSPCRCSFVILLHCLDSLHVSISITLQYLFSLSIAVQASPNLTAELICVWEICTQKVNKFRTSAYEMNTYTRISKQTTNSFKSILKFSRSILDSVTIECIPLNSSIKSTLVENLSNSRVLVTLGYHELFEYVHTLYLNQ